MKNEFLGIYPAIITPFNRRDRSIDLDRLEVLTELLVRANVHGFVVNGSTGEAPYLSREERIKVIDTVRNTASKKIIIAGTGGASLNETLVYSKDAEACGVDALLIVTPYYFKPSREAIYEYYKKIAREVKIPILLYNIPQLTGVELPIDIVTKLIDGEKIIGIKDSSGNISYLINIINAVGNNSLIFCGYDTIVYPALVAGANGLILASINLVPKEINLLYSLVRESEYDEARKIFMELFPLLNIIAKYGVIAVKRGFELMGIDMGLTREPLDIYRDLPPDVVDKLKTILSTKRLTLD